MPAGGSDPLQINSFPFSPIFLKDLVAMLIQQEGHWRLWLESCCHLKTYGLPTILHIGMEKTGSTAIQVWLAKERPALAKRGWHVPKTLGLLNHREVSFLGYDPERRDDGTSRRGICTNQDLLRLQGEILERLRDEVTQARNADQRALLLSTELASSRLTHSREIKRLFSALREAGVGPILIVLFRRDPTSLIESRHSTAIQHEGWLAPHPPAPGTPLADLFGNQVDLERRWMEAIKATSETSLEVYRYAPKTLVAGSSAATVATLLGCDKALQETAKTIRSNPPLPLLNLILLRFCNWLERQPGAWIKRGCARMRPILMKYPLGPWRYQLPLKLKQLYKSYYLESALPPGEAWLMSSSWFKAG
ncbi:hypothetical protein KBY57_13010 [Cyanobium sp. Aljojuca 7D2]|uniref:hypothetical protein n=1 Tax=Cyanobium sp. Aljojuca 7D2 TaxID=2823698 RepID=UPI0020CE4DA6|nr:hypothetical protein [Cyanobium sp. Aljojuca 7D2]MCP9891965.1 hypothetical protein [Cyanobium sp. Aljojuca 7D2]